MACLRLFLILSFVCCSTSVHAQPGKPKTAPEETLAPPEVKIAATVNAVPIFVAEVDREVRQVMRDTKMHPDTQKLLRAQALQQLVDRVVILSYLEKTDQGPSKQDIDLEVERLSKQLKAVNKTLADQAKNLGLSAAGLRRQFAWHLAWTRSLQKSQSDENVAKYFEKHRRDFDGTQIHAAHILFKVTPAGDPQALAAALDQAKRVRAEIADKKLTFEQAASKYSAAPTASNGGDIGLIRRHEPMPETFSRTAFSLEKGAFSEPVVSAYGVHLVQCREIVPGKLTLSDVRAEVEQAMAQYLFSWLADRERPSAKIEFTGAVPHFKPGTQEFAP